MGFEHSVKADLEIELLLRQAAMAKSIIFVNKLNGEDRLWGSEGSRFLDTGEQILAFWDGRGKGKPTNHAYAPCPIVLETTRKGNSLGSGASCE